LINIKQRFEVDQRFVLMLSQDIGQDLSTLMVNAMPQPALLLFGTDKTLHLV